MTQYQFNLSTTEPNNQIGLIRVRQDDDETQIFRATVYENDVPKNLSGVSAEFNMIDVKQHIIVDKARVIDAKNGVLEYRLRKEALQSVGRCTAYFSFKNNNEVIFTTKDFNYNVIWSALSSPMHHGCDYVWTAVDLIESLKDWIEHAMGDFDDWFESVKEILASIDPGGIILKEIIDARNSTPFNMKHSTLKERVDYTDALVKELNDTQNKFKPDEQPWRYLSDLSPFKNAVMQSFFIDSRTSVIYMTQVHADGYRLSRHKPNGQEIDFMVCEKAGHGTHNGYRWIDNDFWIYSYYQDSVGQPALVRFKYKEGITQKYGDNGMQTVFTGQNGKPYITTIINEKEDLILFRFGETLSTGQVHNWCEIRKLSDIDNRINNILYTVDIPLELTTDTDPMQGVTFSEGVLYWYTGDGNPLNDNKVTAFDVKSNKEIWQRKANVGAFLGAYPGDFAEAEGMQFYVDVETGKHALLIGVTVGGANNRSHQIYGIFQEGVYEELNSKATPFNMSDSGGRRKSLPFITNKLSDYKEPGAYYLSTAQSKLFIDFAVPQNWFSSGWLFDVDYTNQGGDVNQTLTKNSFAGVPLKFSRMIGNDAVGAWNYLPVFNKNVGERIPEVITKLSDFNIPGMSVYMTLDDSKRMTDFPKNDGTAGWYIENGMADTAGGFIQTVKRNASIAVLDVYMRTISSDGTANSWYLIRPIVV